MSGIERLTIAGTPPPKGPFSQVVRAGDFLFVSGQGPTHLETGEFVFGTIEDETHLTLKNMIKLVEGAGATAADIVKCSVFLADAGDFAAMNAVYVTYFAAAPPARTTVGAAMVKAEMKIEIDCIAYAPLQQ